MAPKDQDPILRKSGVIYSVAGLTVMRSTLVNPPGHLERGLKNTKRLPHQFMTTVTSVVIKSP